MHNYDFDKKLAQEKIHLLEYMHDRYHTSTVQKDRDRRAAMEKLLGLVIEALDAK